MDTASEEDERQALLFERDEARKLLKGFGSNFEALRAETVKLALELEGARADAAAAREERRRLGAEFEAMRLDLVGELQARDAALEGIRAEAMPIDDAEAMRADLEADWSARLALAEEEVGKGRAALARATREAQRALAEADGRALEAAASGAARELRFESELSDARAQLERLRRAADGDGSAGLLGGDRLRSLQRERLALQLKADALGEENESLHAELDAGLADAEARVRAAAAAASEERTSAQVGRAELASLTRRAASLSAELEASGAGLDKAHARGLSLEAELRALRDDAESVQDALRRGAAAAEARAADAARGAERAREESGRRAEAAEAAAEQLRGECARLRARLAEAEAATDEAVARARQQAGAEARRALAEAAAADAAARAEAEPRPHAALVEAALAADQPSAALVQAEDRARAAAERLRAAEAEAADARRAARAQADEAADARAAAARAEAEAGGARREAEEARAGAERLRKGARRADKEAEAARAALAAERRAHASLKGKVLRATERRAQRQADGRRAASAAALAAAASPPLKLFGAGGRGEGGAPPALSVGARLAEGGEWAALAPPAGEGLRAQPYHSAALGQRERTSAAAEASLLLGGGGAGVPSLGGCASALSGAAPPRSAAEAGWAAQGEVGGAGGAIAARDLSIRHELGAIKVRAALRLLLRLLPERELQLPVQLERLVAFGALPALPTPQPAGGLGSQRRSEALSPGGAGSSRRRSSRSPGSPASESY